MRSLFLLVAFMIGGFAILVNPIKADEVVGAVWKIDFKDDKSSIRMQCTKSGNVFGPGGKKIGTWKGKGAQAKIFVTDGGNRNGDYIITKLEKNPPSYRGRYTNDKGKDIGITVELLKD